MRSHRFRWPSLASALATDQRVRLTTPERSGSGGNGTGLPRTVCRLVSSVRSPDSRSSITWAPNLVAPTPRPVYPVACATRPEYPVPKNGKNREQVSITPPQVWVNRSPSSCGKVSKKCPARVRKVSGRWSSAGSMRLP